VADSEIRVMGKEWGGEKKDVVGGEGG